MTKGFPPTALETKKCPPHHYILDSYNLGTCCKCGAIEDFSKPELVAERKRMSLLMSSAGGKKNKGKPSKRKGRR